MREQVNGLTEESAVEILEESGWRMGDAIERGRDEQLQVIGGGRLAGSVKRFVLGG